MTWNFTLKFKHKYILFRKNFLKPIWSLNFKQAAYYIRNSKKTKHLRKLWFCTSRSVRYFNILYDYIETRQQYGNPHSLTWTTMDLIQPKSRRDYLYYIIFKATLELKNKLSYSQQLTSSRISRIVLVR